MRLDHAHSQRWRVRCRRHERAERPSSARVCADVLRHPHHDSYLSSAHASAHESQEEPYTDLPFSLQQSALTSDGADIDLDHDDAAAPQRDDTPIPLLNP